jgi:hypothetical protein
LIKYGSLTEETRAKINCQITESMLGLADNEVTSIGKVPIRLHIEERIYEIDLHVVNDSNLPTSFDGLIGSNLLDQTRATVNYDTYNLHFGIWNEDIPLFREYQLLPRTRNILTIETHPTTLETGIVSLPNNDHEVLIPPIINNVADNHVAVVAINPTEEIKSIALPRAKIIEPTHILTINHKKVEKTDRLDLLRKTIDITHLSTDEQRRLLQIIESYAEIFFLPGDKLESNVKHYHEIRTAENTLPIYVKNYRFPEIHKMEVEKQMEELLKQGIVQPSESPWNAPIWVVPKKLDNDGKQKWRIVLDYRRLNQITLPDKYPLPNIEDIFDSLHDAKLFTTIDLASGFHQIAVHPKDIEKTAFSTNRGHYEFKRMPFGLINAPATFQRVMNQALAGTVGSECFVYLDDIIVFSSCFESHINKLKIIFQRLREHKLLIQLAKTEFLKPQVFYLGHTLSAEGLGLQQIKVNKILNYPRPTNVKEVQRLLGMAGYYRRFIAEVVQVRG